MIFFYGYNKPMTSRLYNSRWQKARLTFLAKNPLCAFHAKIGQVVPATVVDHITPHKGDIALFWDKANWQALCKQCHDSDKQRIEKSSGVVIEPKPVAWHGWGA
jgi:5-methylcytosine-specific restriction protein A